MEFGAAIVRVGGGLLWKYDRLVSLAAQNPPFTGAFSHQLASLATWLWTTGDRRRFTERLCWWLLA